jgi:hypothetical protein
MEDTGTAEATHGKLLASLLEVRKKFDENEDSWRERLVQTFLKYLQAIEIEPDLCGPVFAFRNELANARFLAERKLSGKKGKPLDPNSAHTLAAAAAAATVLKDHHDYTIPAAIKAAANSIGVKIKRLSTFRSNVSSGNLSGAIRQNYDQFVVEFKTWPASVILENLTKLRRFVS